ncbi:mpv17-like protein [Caerostris extrusa]|uniref:Mpv17-like protein n=1 Tax=Caerostris extrusa TaxID=172846 RepID=A0AAV4S8W6_CAEEX|nr:mpv17-like protein [Caerostris extrusa]
MWNRTKQIFQKRPLLTNMMSFGTMYVGAEVAQQLILMQSDHEKKSINWTMVRNYAIIGWAGIGPALFCWYRMLDRVLPAATGIVVAKKVCTDQLISSPACIGMFFWR